jgi:hypothetical protein
MTDVRHTRDAATIGLHWNIGDHVVTDSESCNRVLHDGRNNRRKGFGGRFASVCLFAILLNADRPMRADQPSTPNDIAVAIKKHFSASQSLRVAWKVRLALSKLPMSDFEADLFSVPQMDDYAVAGVNGEKRYRHSITKYKSGISRETTYTLDGGVAHCQTLEANKIGKTHAESYFVMFDTDEKGTGGLREQAAQYFEYIGSPYYDGVYLDVWRREAQHNGGTKVRSGPFSVVAALESGAYRLRSSREMIGTSNCLVLENPGRDKIWLDPDRGHALVQRIWNWEKDGTPMMCYRNSDFKEVAAGLWLPRIAQRDAYTHPSSRHAGKVQFTTTAEVTSFAINNVQDSLFQFHPAVGSMAVDFTRIKSNVTGKWKGVSYTIGANPENTEENLKNAALAQQDDLFDLIKFWKWPFRLTLIVLNACLVFVLLFIMFRKKCRGSAAMT